MDQAFTLFDLIIIIGIVQGMIASVLLLFRNNIADRFLALSIIAFCLLSSKMLLHTLGLWDLHLLRYLPLGVDLVIQPLIYYYVVQIIEPGHKIKSWEWLHFLPFIVSETYSLTVYFNVLSTTDLAAKDAIAESFYFNQVKHLEDYFTLCSTFVYLTVGMLKIKGYKTWLKANISETGYPTFNWLRMILIQLSIIGTVLLVNLLLDRVLFPGSSNFHRWQFFNIVVAGHIYYLGFIGYSKGNHYHHHRQPVTQTKVEKLTPQQVSDIVSRIEIALSQERLYLNPSLSASELAGKIATTQGNLSYALNYHYKKNFRELINQYRVEEAKSKLTDPSLGHLSVLGIAYESGFSSEASFYRIFKKSTGSSPTKYQKELL